MPDFAVSLLDDNSDVALSASQGVLTINDYSNYKASTESGNEVADFADYYKIIITNPDATTYTYCSLTGFDATLNTPDNFTGVSYPPIPTTYNYDTEGYGDGVYGVQLIAVPTWATGKTYQASDDAVYYNGTIYECATTHTADVFATDLAAGKWTASNDAGLPEKYKTTEYISVTCDLHEDFADLVITAADNAREYRFTTGDYDDKKVLLDTIDLWLMLKSQDPLMNQQETTKAQQNINTAQQIAAEND